MDSIIQYYYNLFPDNIQYQAPYYSFQIQNQIYYFLPYYGSLNDINTIYQISKSLYQNKVPVHEMIFNRNQALITLVNNQPYILMKIHSKMENITLELFLNFLSQTKRITMYPMQNEWPKLWAEKIDYFEYQIGQLSRKFPILSESLPYYVGLAENAIGYIQNAMDQNPVQENRIVHKRASSLDTNITFYNPLNIMVDHKTRDIVEYMKSLFLEKKDPLTALNQYMDMELLSVYDVQMLYGRLLFPTFYFDLYEKIILGEIEESKILPILDCTNEYEEFIRNVYYLLSREYPFPSISWLHKKTSFN